MQRRQLSERRAKEAASSLIREVAGKKEIDSGSAANKQLKCTGSLPTAGGSLQSVGTRIACIPIHRLSKDSKLTSPKRTTAVAECSPRTNYAARSIQFNKLPDTGTSQPATAGSCRQLVNTFSEFHCAQVDNQVPRRLADNKKVDVKVKTPEKCCKIADVKKTSPSPIATDLCSVSLSRIVIPEKNDLSGATKNECKISSCRDSPVRAHTVAVDDATSKTAMNLSRPTDITDDNTALSSESQSDLSCLPVSIVYPSCEQNVFLGSFGLANKAELPQLKSETRNQLHREAGGKLRRSIKPNMATQMIQRRTKSMRCVSFEDNADVSGMEVSSRSLQTFRENSPQSLNTGDLPNVSIKKLSSTLSKRLKSSNVDKSHHSALSAEADKTDTLASTEDEDSQSSLSILADLALADLEISKTQDTNQVTSAQYATKKLSAKSKGFVKSKSMVEWSTSEVVPSRRSSRNFGLQRRAWHHLLRANPDEHDPVTSGQTSTASSPGREQTGQRTKLFKSSSMKSSSDSLKSDVSGSPQKASFSQRARVSATNLPIDRKRTQKELTTDQVKLSKKLRHSSTTHPVKENSVTTVSAPVPSQSGITYTFTENGLVHSNHDPAPDLSFLSYSYKELECLTPHMCNVCWVNDHMYCRNMKRISRELPNFSGCIHYIACEHYRQSTATAHTCQEIRSNNRSLHWTNQQTGEKVQSPRVVSAEDLLCEEDMLESESDLSNDGVDGTELLQIQLKARAEQIFRSLGVSELPKGKSPPLVSTVPESSEIAEEDAVVIPEEYAAEIVINADCEWEQDVAEIRLSSDAVVRPFTASRQENGTLVKGEPRWNGNCNGERGYDASRSTCSLASFDGTSSDEPSVSVKVRVHPISDNRVVLKYPKKRSPTEYVHLDVTFPDAAADEVVNNYVRNDVARLMCEKKSASLSDIPLTTDVADVQLATESADGGLQSAVHVVSSKTLAVDSADKHENVYLTIGKKMLKINVH